MDQFSKIILARFPKLLTALFIFGSSLLMTDLAAQCELLTTRDINVLVRGSHKNKVKKLNKRNAKLLSIEGDKEKCEYRTYTACKNFISAEQWHWTEIISFNSCDKILTYSTSDRSHFLALKQEFLKKYRPIGVRTYDGLEFQVFQNRRGQVVEIDEHPNPQGLTFYLMNVIRRSR